ncbi:MAG: NAD+ synthase [Proteobacteria bacterium]|nr:NAD+ synthase [Pseudomonadota bacterium]
MKTLRIALAQINPTVGDLKGNTDKIIEYIKKAKGHDTDIVAFPELAITGYPPEDLLFNKGFIKDNIACLGRIIPHTEGIIAVVGFVDSINKGRGKGIYNAAAVMQNRSLVDTCYKSTFRGQGIYDESRYFLKGKRNPFFNVGGLSFSVVIGNDIFHDAGLIVNVDAFPYWITGNTQKEKRLCVEALKHHGYLAYVNIVGGQDEWVFGGNSSIINKNGEIVAKSPLFEESILIRDIETEEAVMESDEALTVMIPVKLVQQKKVLRKKVVKQQSPVEEVYNALCLGTRDYVRKNGFQKAVLGLSGGIDSALVAAIAKDALGKENVFGVSMPSKYTSEESKVDAEILAKNLCIKLIEVPIDTLFETYLGILQKPFKGPASQITLENLQPRVRANILMALSNNYGWFVLSTGNKSEVGTGYSTLYGDTAGGYAVIKDVSKTLVYKLSHWVNEKEGREVIPERILNKSPSAELRHDQKDTDTLPPYDLLDPILTAHIEDNRTADELIASGYDAGLVKTIIDMVHRNEYKRRQSAPGPKITKRSFGKDWNFPITNKYRY